MNMDMDTNKTNSSRSWVKTWKQFDSPGFKPGIVNEAKLGVRRVEQICKEIATELGVQYSKSKPVRRVVGVYTKVVENTFMVGGAKIFTRASKVPGMSGDFDLWVINPATDRGYEIYVGWGSDESFIEKIKEMVTTTSNGPKVMSKEELDSIVGDLRQNDESFDDSQAFDIAEGILSSEEGMEEAIKKYYQVDDVLGWLANKV